MRLTLLPESEQTFEIKRTGVRVSVGRKQGCDIMLNDIVVSGLHCYLTVSSNSSAVIEDQSTNGTYVNGIKVGKGMTMELRHGDTLTMGKPNAAGAQGASISFKITFDGSESANAIGGVSSVVYKQEIEDLKVVAGTAEHRSEVAERKAMEMGMKLGSTELDLKRVREENVELSVRNDVMRKEIDSLRMRLATAERSVNDAERRADTLQTRVDLMGREYDEIQALKNSLNLKHTTLSQEIERLRQENFDLRNRATMTSDMRKRVMANLMQIQQLAGSTVSLFDEGSSGTDTVRFVDTNSPPTVQVRRPIRGYPVIERPVEGARSRTPESDEYDLATRTIIAEDMH
jgi:hypothetical protein